MEQNNEYVIESEFKSALLGEYHYYVRDGVMVTLDLDRATKYPLDKALELMRELNKVSGDGRYRVVRYEVTLEKYERIEQYD